MGQTPLWVTLLAPIASYIGVGVTAFIAYHSWKRRPSVSWQPVRVFANSTDISEDAKQFFSETNDVFSRSEGVRLGVALFNSGDLQASGVKLYAYGCDLESMQFANVNGKPRTFKGKSFPFVEPRSVLYLALENREVHIPYLGAGKPNSAYFRIYWIDSPARSPKYLKQDFEWFINNEIGVSNTVHPLGHPENIGEKEYVEGEPSVDPVLVRGFKR